MVTTNLKSLKVTRLGAMPNTNGSYAYRVEGADSDAVKELLESVEGVYDARDGEGKIIFSRNRIGHQNVPINAQFRVVEQVKNGQGTGRFFINLIDASVEEVGDFFSKVVLAERFGINQSAAAVAAFYNVKGKASTTAAGQAQTAQAAEPAQADPAPQVQATATAE